MIPTSSTIMLGIALATLAAVLYAANRFMRAFYWRIAFCLVPLVIAGLVVANAVISYRNGQGGFKFGVDLMGGTILVYELDIDKFPDGKIPLSYKPDELAASLKRRIDPADLKNVIIRPVSDTRIEIILATGGKHQADVERKIWADLIEKVQEEWPSAKKDDYNASLNQTQVLLDEVHKQNPTIKLEAIDKFIRDNYKAGKGDKHLTAEEVQDVRELISRVGSLEFRILANEHDDREAIEAAKKYFTDIDKNPDRLRDLEDRAFSGKPPPPPPSPDDEGFTANLEGYSGKYKYSWLELGRAERKQLGLSDSEEANPANLLWKTAAEARKRGDTFPMPKVLGLLYSRAVINPKRLLEKDQSKKFEYFVLTRDPETDKEVTGFYLIGADASSDAKGPAVSFRFNSAGGNLFGELTTRNAPQKGDEGSSFKRYLAVVLDGVVESAPRLNAHITTEGQITGDFTPVEIDRLVKILRAGALPATLKPQPVSENTMGATLGEDTIRKGTFSVGLAFVFILLFMVVYYEFAGLVASVALLANLLLTVAFMVAVNATFTLPGLAGLVLMLGMAVDANVLIYERLREERDRGASLSLAIRNGYDRAFPTIIDTHLSSIFTAIVLYVVGNDQLKGFGVSLTVGLLISLFTSLVMTRLLFDIWLDRNWLHKLNMRRLFSKPNINFMGIRYYWFTATILLTIFGISVFVMRLPNDLNIDFVGGTAYGGQLTEAMKLGELRALLEESNQKKMLVVDRVKELTDSDGRGFDITYRNLDGSEITRRIHFPNRPGEKAPVRGPDGVIVQKQSTLTPAEREAIVKESASKLPDMSVEQIFEGFGQGDASPLFTVRTSEKAPELVQASIARLLGDKLKRIAMNYAVTKAGHDASLTFAPAADGTEAQDEKVFASPSQVRMLLEREFKEKKISTAFNLVPEGENQDGRYPRMLLKLNDPGIPAETLVTILKSTQDEFAARPQPDRLENFDSQLAKQTQTRAMVAILASWAAILLYLWLRFGSWTFGLAAVLCLIHDLFFTMGIIAFCYYLHDWVPGLASFLLLQDFKIDLPAVAALLTLVGYSVNDTIVVFDRIREVRGKNPELTAKMINDSVNQTLSRTLLTSFATWLVVIVLYLFGGDGVHLFAFCMVVGVIVGTYSSIYIASPLLLIFGEGVPTGERKMKTQTVEANV